MGKRTWAVASLGLVTVGTLVTLASPAATGAKLRYVNLEVPAFAAREYSVHNSQGGGENACVDPAAGPVFVPLQNGGENRGDLDNGEGSYLASLQLPQGMKMTAFSLFANDNDTDADVHAFLLRKRLLDGLSPAAGGYRVMAEAHSSDAVNAMRQFTDDTVSGPKVNNAKFGYYVEVVDCGVPEPYAVQVAYSG